MHVENVERDIVKYTELHCFGANTYDEYYDFNVDSFVLRYSTFQSRYHSLLSSGLVQVLECNIQPK